jgi:hypothetical protein
MSSPDPFKSPLNKMSWKSINIIIEKLKIGYVVRVIHGAYCNMKHPEYNLFKALALKSGLPGSKVFKFTTKGQKVTLFPMGQHLDQHGNNEITDLSSLKWDFVKPGGKIRWIIKFRLHERQYLSEFVKEGPVRIHYLPQAKRLAVGGGRNRMLALMRLGFRNAMQFKQAEWDKAGQRYVNGDIAAGQRYVNGDIAVNYPGKPVWDDIPPDTSKQGWVDKTKRWDDAYQQGLRLTMGEVYKAIF